MKLEKPALIDDPGTPLSKAERAVIEAMTRSMPAPLAFTPPPPIPEWAVSALSNATRKPWPK